MSQQPPSASELTLVTLNVHDRTYGNAAPRQSGQIDSTAQALLAIDKQLDVVCLQETEGDNGRVIAEQCGFKESYWEKQPHHRNEHIGMFGEMVGEVGVVRLSVGKIAVKTVVGGVPIYGIHFLTRRTNMLTQQKEGRYLQWDMLGQRDVIVMGDFNRPHVDLARSALYKTGFRSIDDTLSTPEYADAMWGTIKNIFFSDGVELDDVLVKGNVEVVGSGFVTGANADRYGKWATVRIASSERSTA